MAEKKGIGGWLILPAIGIALNPFLILWNILVLIVTRHSWEYILAWRTRPMLFDALTTLEVLGSVAFFVFSLELAFKFFKKRAEAPQLAVWFMVLKTLFALICWLLSIGARDIIPQLTFDYGLQAFAYIVASSIWIPYFKLSKRVKATFVN